MKNFHSVHHKTMELVRSNAQLATLTQDEFDDMVVRITPHFDPTPKNLIANKDFIDKASTVAAYLDHIRFERQERTVFTSAYFRSLCNELLADITGNPEFDIDVWFGEYRKDLKFDPRDPEAALAFSKSMAMQVDWIKILMNMEMQSPGFIKVLHNCIQMNTETDEKMIQRRKKILPDLMGANETTNFRHRF
jgi:hypothetical protein